MRGDGLCLLCTTRRTNPGRFQRSMDSKGTLPSNLGFNALYFGC